MSKWFSSAWFEKDDRRTGEEVRLQLHGPFETDTGRQEAVDELVEENGEDYVIAIVRFDIEGESVPELVE